MIRMRKTMTAGVLCLAMLTAACADDGGGGGNTGAGGPSGSGATGASAAGGGAYGSGGGSDYEDGDGGGTSGSTGAGGSSVVTVTQVNYQFSPAKVSVKKGDTITISDTNPSTPHTFTIPGTDIDVANDPQQSQDVTIDLKPGTYPFICRFHKAQEMEGTLVVE